MNLNAYRTGIRRGLPVGIGYFSVSFGFGAMAAAQGIKALDAALMSLTNYTSAGQFAGITLIVSCAGFWELVLTQLIINSRYALMGVALSQRMGKNVGFWPRLLIGHLNSDETFAIAMAERLPLTTPFMLGLGSLPILGWVGGTLLGSLAGSMLPLTVQTALGVMLYGMFVAIVIPPARKERPILIAVAVAVALSCLFAWLPGLKEVSPGLAIVICTVAASALCAVLFPVSDEEAEP